MNQCLEDMKASTQHSTLPLPLPISSTSHLDRYPMRHIRFAPTYAHLQADQKGSQKGRPRPHGKAFPTGRTTSAHEQPPKKIVHFDLTDEEKTTRKPQSKEEPSRALSMYFTNLSLS